MLAGRGYKTKKELKANVGKQLQYTETSIFGPEYKPTGCNTVVGPSADKRVWYAHVFTENGTITKVF